MYAAKALQQGQPADPPQIAVISQRMRQPIIEYAAAQMMVHADVCGEPAQNCRQVVMRASTQRRFMKIPFAVARPECLFELMLNIEQPDPYRAGKKHDRPVHEKEWTNADRPDSDGGQQPNGEIRCHGAQPWLAAA